MLDADAVINNSSQKVGGSNAYPDPAPKKWVGPDPEKHRIYAPAYAYFTPEPVTLLRDLRLRFVILMTDTWRVKRCIIIIIITTAIGDYFTIDDPV